MKKLLFVITMLFSHTVSANLLENAFDKFSHLIFKAGWPTATYVDYEFFDVNHSERFVVVQMNGISYWSDGKLNMRIKVTFNSNYGIDDVDVIKHNALLMPPFKTLEGLGKIIKESNSSGSSAPAPAPAPSYAYSPENNIANIVVNNKCNKPINIAVRYMKVSGDWVTDGWWTISPSKKTRLVGDHGKLETDNSILYFFARSTDRDIIWSGTDNSKYFQGEELKMIQVDDADGNRDISLKCSGWYLLLKICAQ